MLDARDRRDCEPLCTDPGATRTGNLFARLLVTVAVMVSAAAMLGLLGLIAHVAPATAADAAATGASDQTMMWGFIAAAASTGIAALAAAYAVGHIGSAAMGALGERPELAGRALIFVGLAEGIAIYGLIISVMILARLG